MKHINKFESNDWNPINPIGDNPVPFGTPREGKDKSDFIKHYFVGQKMEVKGLSRKNSDGSEFIVNGIGVIESISKMDDDIVYVVEFNTPHEYRSPYSGKKYTDKTTSWNVLHNEEKENIVRVW